MTDSQSVSMSVCLGVEHPCGTCDQILLHVGMLLSEICGLVSVRHPLWWEDDLTLMSHLRLPQPGGPGSCIYIPQEQGCPVIPPGIGFPVRLLLQLAWLQWRYSNPLPGSRIYIPQEQGCPVIPLSTGFPVCCLFIFNFFYIMGVQMSELSRLCWLMRWAARDMWTDSLYFL
jgi:hypothetical protein